MVEKYRPWQCFAALIGLARSQRRQPHPRVDCCHPGSELPGWYDGGSLNIPFEHLVKTGSRITAIFPCCESGVRYHGKTTGTLNTITSEHYKNKKQIKRSVMEMETTSQFKALDERYVMPAFSRICNSKGRGITVWDATGNQYLDCVAGIASAAPDLPSCGSQSDLRPGTQLIHCSNLYYVPHQGDMAKKTVDYRHAQGFLLKLGSRSH